MTKTGSQDRTGGKGSRIARRSAARLMAVQAVYEFLYTGKRSSELVEDYLYHRSGTNLGDDVEAVQPDGDLFTQIVKGAAERKSDILNIVGQHVHDNQGEGLDLLLKAILVCATYEFIACPDTDAPIIISDYVEVTKSFYGGQESRLVNGISDSIARTVRF